MVKHCHRRSEKGGWRSRAFVTSLFCFSDSWSEYWMDRNPYKKNEKLKFLKLLTLINWNTPVLGTLTIESVRQTEIGGISLRIYQPEPKLYQTPWQIIKFSYICFPRRMYFKSSCHFYTLIYPIAIHCTSYYRSQTFTSQCLSSLLIFNSTLSKEICQRPNSSLMWATLTPNHPATIGFKRLIIFRPDTAFSLQPFHLQKRLLRFIPFSSLIDHAI